MMQALPAQSRVRLAQLLGMVGSDHDGEALNAARLANKLVRDLGLTWPDVLGLGAVASAAPMQPPRPRSLDDEDRELVRFCNLSGAPFDLRQRDFLTGFSRQLGRRQPLSARQRDVLADIVEFATLYTRRAA
jgi:hypothetical protein